MVVYRGYPAHPTHPVTEPPAQAGRGPEYKPHETWKEKGNVLARKGRNMEIHTLPQFLSVDLA